MKYFILTLLPLLAYILYTDFKYKKVNLIALAIALLLSFIRPYLSSGAFGTLLSYILMNSVLAGILLSAVILYTRLRKIKFGSSFGLGDILFLFIATFHFAPVSFLFFICLSSFSGLLYFLFSNKKKAKKAHVPFAGLMAGVLSLVIIFDIFTGYSSYNDLPFFQLID